MRSLQWRSHIWLGVLQFRINSSLSTGRTSRFCDFLFYYIRVKRFAEMASRQFSLRNCSRHSSRSPYLGLKHISATEIETIISPGHKKQRPGYYLALNAFWRQQWPRSFCHRPGSHISGEFSHTPIMKSGKRTSRFRRSVPVEQVSERNI